jgi:hypothetical protein
LFLPATWAGSTPVAYTPRKGSRERTVILDALRVPVMKWFRREGYPKKIIFQVGHLKVYNGWAYFTGSALKADGSQFEKDYLCGGIDAILRKRGNRWQVLHWGIASDVSVGPEIKRKYPQAPRAIFPKY